ncbi:MAG: AraC family transcriptional regulator [Alphaproteobacteria bacterium]
MTNFNSIEHPPLEYVGHDDSSSLYYREHGTPCPLIQWHFHPEYELHLMVGTTGKSFVGGYVGDFEPYDLYLIGPYIPHNWISDVDDGIIIPFRDQVVTFTEQWRKSWISSSKELSMFEPLWEKAKKAIYFPPEIGKEIQPLLNKMRDDKAIYRLGYFTEILVILLEASNHTTLCKRDHYGKYLQTSNPYFKKTIEYIQENMHTNLTAYELANYLNMSYSQFSRWFSKQFGIGFSQYLNAVRIHKATELLYSSKMSISAICFEVGYNTIANFNQQFKRRKNMTPRAYRAYLKGNKSFLSCKNL